MKIIVKYVVGLAMFFGTSAITYAGLPQEKKLTKQEKRAIKDREIAINYPKTLELVEGLRFVLTADYLIFKDGSKMPVDSRINFIVVDSTKSTIQTGSGSTLGYNGVGGMTANGRVTNIKLTKNDSKKTINLTFDAATVNSRFRIFFQFNADGISRATVTTLTSTGMLTFEGAIKGLDQLDLIQGDANF